MIGKCSWRRAEGFVRLSCDCGCCLPSVLQSLDEVSCRGLKHLLLGSIHKCHGNMRDAVQVTTAWALSEDGSLSWSLHSSLLFLLWSSHSSWLLEMSTDDRSTRMFPLMPSMSWDVYFLQNQRSTIWHFYIFVYILHWSPHCFSVNVFYNLVFSI